MSATTARPDISFRWWARARGVRHRCLIAAVLLLALVFYLWTAGSSFPFVWIKSDGPTSQDTYNLLTTAFLHGHLFLPFKVPPGLVALRDPYNPVENAAYQGAFHDLILYHDRLYSAWGPSPTLLFILVRITGYRLATSLAVALYSFGGLIAAVALMHRLARRFVPGMPDWMLVVATIGLALTNVAPFLLRRPAEYEVAISGALCFEMGGLYMVAAACLRTNLSRRRLAMGALLLGLALLARPTMAVDLPLLIVLGWVLVRRQMCSVRALVVACLPFLVCVVALMVYNELRFGGAGDFGTQYQLAGIEVLHRATEQLSYVPPGMFSYLFIPAQISLAFPHVFLQTTAQYPFPLPHGYEGTPGVIPPEFAGGMLPTMPITILLLALPVMWLRRRPGERDGLLVIGAGVLLTLGVMLLLSYALFGTTQRYEVDYASLGLLSAFLLWGMIVARLRRGGWARRLIITLGCVLTLLGAAAGVAVSFTGYLNLLDLAHPAVYSRLQSLTTPFVTAVTKLTGRPALTEISSPLGETPPSGFPYTQFDAAGSSTTIGGAPTTITVVAPRDESASLSALARPGTVPLAGQVIDVSSDGRTTPVPVLFQSLRMPIELHRGMNQIVLVSAGATPAQTAQTRLYDLRVTSYR